MPSPKSLPQLSLRPQHPTGRPLAALADLLATARPAGETAVTGVTLDSRTVQPGDLYAALPGAHTHGARFAVEAAGRGAVAVLTDRDGLADAQAAGLPVLVVADPRAVLAEVARWVYGDPSRELLLVGVTGTNGKTTTAYLIESGLKAAGHLSGLVGTVETRIGDLAVPSVRTTPEASDLQALFATMRERGVTAAAMEVSSHALALHRVDGVSYDVAAFTNLTQDHLDFHASLEDYFAAKARLFTPRWLGTRVVNIDDPHGRTLAATTAVPVTTYSASGDSSAHWWVDNVRAGALGTVFDVHGPGGAAFEAGVQLAGAFNVANALCAIVSLTTAGVPTEVAVRGVAALPGVPGRLERIDVGQSFVALVDYAHTPGAVEALLAALRPVTDGRLLVVLGCGGDRDRAKRPLMGAAAASLADVAIFTDDNPRGERSEDILAAIWEGALTVPEDSRAELVVEADRAAAIAVAVSLARAGDTVVVAGKGHEQGQESAGVVVPFDDRHVLRAALGGVVG